MMLEALAQERRAIVLKVSALTDSQLDFSPDGAWSAREIVEHLVLSDEMVGRSRSEFAPERPPFRFLPHRLRRALILGALRKNVVLPLPGSEFAPQGRTPLETLLQRWDAVHKSIRAEVALGDPSEPRYEHPVLGRLTPPQMLRLGIEHTRYHARGLDALIACADFPAAG